MLNLGTQFLYKLFVVILGVAKLDAKHVGR